jgi:2,4-dienoyl-CoA reductase-like NADH-dependent reductase (Old Yellow Enzyme family)
LLDIVQDIIAVWGPERVGVQLGPFAWMGRLEDLQSASFYCQLIDVLVEMEVAYIHIAGAYTSERGDLSSSPLGRHLRRVFPGMLIASGAYTPAGAVAAAERLHLEASRQSLEIAAAPSSVGENRSHFCEEPQMRSPKKEPRDDNASGYSWLQFSP